MREGGREGGREGERERDLSQKTINKRLGSSWQECPKCSKSYTRLDTHLRRSATCRILPHPPSSTPRPTSSSESSTSAASGVQQGSSTLAAVATSYTNTLAYPLALQQKLSHVHRVGTL